MMSKTGFFFLPDSIVARVMNDDGSSRNGCGCYAIVGSDAGSLRLYGRAIQFGYSRRFLFAKDG